MGSSEIHKKPRNLQDNSKIQPNIEKMCNSGISVFVTLFAKTFSQTNKKTAGHGFVISILTFNIFCP